MGEQLRGRRIGDEPVHTEAVAANGSAAANAATAGPRGFPRRRSSAASDRQCGHGAEVSTSPGVSPLDGGKILYPRAGCTTAEARSRSLRAKDPRVHEPTLREAVAGVRARKNSAALTTAEGPILSSSDVVYYLRS